MRDIFEVRARLVGDYSEFTSAFVDPLDERVAAHVTGQLEQGSQWPDPWLSLNPNFAAGGRVDELANAGVLHPECARIFRINKDESDASGQPMMLHRHQAEAVRAARDGHNYVLTTGTGSGKSLAYIVPIVDAVLRAERRPGIKAIIVYPMNALANSQVEELTKFLRRGYPHHGEPVTFARYTGQETEQDKERILADPPDILLTNYVMLDLVLTRPRERQRLVRAARGLRFLVLDELHTYRGRQGADVAMLVRRVRDACEATDLQCVGTSATMSTRGSAAERHRVVADVASLIFGDTVDADHVIGETLVRATPAGPAGPATDAALAERVRAASPPATSPAGSAASYAELSADPLAGWIETRFGVTTDPETDGLVRRDPVTVERAAAELSARTGQQHDACAEAIRLTLHAGGAARHPDTDRPLFAFRLHQFL
ncbi:MAG TPA: DEAD/DEAH box helicase, partial [Mycobacteriales bacterium]|nr:DEAD/DEAH box helicase [Mycobacteriales bacterium]